MNRRNFLSSAVAVGALATLSRLPIAAVARQEVRNHDGAKGTNKGVKKMIKTDAEWKRILTPTQYEVTRHQGTEAPYSSPLNSNHEHGVFECICCELPLFSSEANLIPAPVGRVSGRPFPGRTCRKKRITLSVWHERKWSAPVVMLTSDTFLMMAESPPDCATA